MLWPLWLLPVGTELLIEQHLRPFYTESRRRKWLRLRVPWAAPLAYKRAKAIPINFYNRLVLTKEGNPDEK
jgi:hypothetical protein